MKILFSHSGVIKLFALQKSRNDNYENMRTFVRKNFPELPQNFIVKYKDEDGDMIVICSNKDIEALFENKVEDYVRASIQEEKQSDAQSDLSQEESNEQYDSEHQSDSQVVLKSDDDEVEIQREEQQDSNEEQNSQAHKEIHSATLPEDYVHSKPSSVNHTYNSGIAKTQEQSMLNKLESVNKSLSSVHQPIKNEQQQQQVEHNAMEQRLYTDKHVKQVVEIVTQKLPLTEQVQNRYEVTVNTQIQEQKTQIPYVFPPQQNIDQYITNLVTTLLNSELQKKLESLIPQLSQKIKKQIQSSFHNINSQSEKSKEFKEFKPKIIHQTQCSHCLSSNIQGIRYKCLECKLYNLCEGCEQTVQHEHHLLKMKFPEQKKENIADQRIQLTNKCFFLSSYFGAYAHYYQKFVEKHFDKTQKELFNEYLKQHGKKLKDIIGKKIQEIAQKLGFYFGQDYRDFMGLVKDNPTQTFENLILFVKNTDEKRNLIEYTQMEQFKMFIQEKYGIDPQQKNDYVRVEIVSNYYSDHRKQMTLQELKENFCKQYEGKNSKQWKPIK